VGPFWISAYICQGETRDLRRISEYYPKMYLQDQVVKV
jgi:hypothetical protein